MLGTAEHARMIYSTAQAAAQLGLTVRGIKYLIYESETITPDGTVGKSLYFTQATLDRFNQTRRKPGWPRKDGTR